MYVFSRDKCPESHKVTQGEATCHFLSTFYLHLTPKTDEVFLMKEMSLVW